MAWRKEAISDGEVDALYRTALAACNEDTCYPLWRGSHTQGRGECLNMARWLVSRLGGHIGVKTGHYVWLSPDKSYVIDLTGDHGRTNVRYRPNLERLHETATVDNERTDRFTKRANRIFDQLDRILRLSVDLGGDAFPAQEPQAEDDSERFNDSSTEPDQYWHDEPDAQTPEGEYQFVYANGQLEVSPNHSHDELSGHIGIDPSQHMGPFAAGHVVVNQGRATWEVQANINLHALFRVFKEATKNYGWTWGGMTDAQGQPVLDEFGPKKSAKILHYVCLHDHLYLGRTSAADLTASSDRDNDGGRAFSGTIRVIGSRAWVDPVYLDVLPHLFEWAGDSNLTLYGGNDNVIKTIPDLQQENVGETTTDPYGDVRNPVEPSPQDERLPSGLYRCPACAQLFPNWHEYQKHRREQESWGDPDRSDNGDRGFPEPDPGQFGDGAHFTEMRQEPGITTGKVVALPAQTWREAVRVDGFAADHDDTFYIAYRNGDPLGYAAVSPEGQVHIHSAVDTSEVTEALWAKLYRYHRSLSASEPHPGWVQSKSQLWSWSADKAPTDLLEATVPFIYDVDKDTITAGQPGARTSDIPGRFTPGGIVEGQYEPGGKVVIRTMTSVPYTVRHMIELWYYTNPQLEVKSVHLQDDAGKDTRLAGIDVGAQVKQAAVMDPAVQTATTTLQTLGGEVFAVGGVVRDAVMGKEPHDIDLMVTGLPKEKVAQALESLPGKVDFTGKDFGVFRYRHKGHEVEIALPRRDRSTGAGHKDFTVVPDHTMTPEEDFYRRDFTANAMGVNLRNGRLVDPFNGAQDTKAGILRTLNDKSLSEDPLRVVRALVANSRHGFEPDEDTRAQMKNSAVGLQSLPTERIQAELDKLMSADNPARAVRLAHETGVLKYVLPEVDAAFGFDQNNPHHEKELGEHLLSVLDRISRKTRDPDLRLAALLHDIGKPASAWLDPVTQKSHYYEKHLPDGTVLGADHETVGSAMARQRMNTLHYPNDRIKRVSELVAHHMYPGFSTTKGARRFLQRVGDHADDLFTLRWADQGGKGNPPDPRRADDLSWNVDNNRKLVSQVRTEGEPTGLTDLAINGNDLINAGIQPGPLMGQILRNLTEKVIEDPSLNNRETLLQLATQPATLQDNHEKPLQKGSAQGEEVQLPSLRGQVTPKLAQGDEEAQVGWEPSFPDSADAEEVHDQALADHGQAPEPLWNPGGLESAMGRAANHWHYGDGTSGEKVADAAGALAHGIGMAQAFVDGNKRTAYHTARGFLAENGYGQLSPVDHDDEELADHLIGHGKGTHSLEDTQRMFRSRLNP